MSVQISAVRRRLSVAAAAATLAVAAAPAAWAAAPGARAAGSQPNRELRMPRAAGAGVVFGGVTRDGWPVVLAISPDAKRLRGSVIALVLRCTSGAVFADADGFGGLAVGPRGNVHVAGSIPAVTTPAVTMTGGSHAMVGTLNRRRETFSGRWRLRLNFKLDNGQINHCDSGWVGFSARL